MGFNVKQVLYAAPGKYKFEVTHETGKYTCYLCPGAPLNNLVVNEHGRNVTDEIVGCCIRIACSHELRR